MITRRRAHRKIARSFTKQHSQFYCGLACLTSVVQYHGGEISQEKLREESGTTLNGTSMLGLYQAARKLGFEVGGFETNIENLKEQNEPVILHIIKDKNLEHFVVCYGFDKDKFIIGDPGIGISTYSDSDIEKVWKSKTLLKLSPGNGFITKKIKSKSQRNWFIELIKDDYPILSIAAFLGVVISVLGLATAIFSQKLIDQILPQRNTHYLFFGVVIFTLVLLARAIVTYVRGVFLVRQSKAMNVRLISTFFGKLLFLPKPFFDSTSTGDMVARMNDASRIQKVVVFLSSQIVIDILVVIISAGYIFFYSVSTGFICLISIPIFGFMALYFNRKVIGAQLAVMQSYSATESKYIDTISGVKTIKTFNKETLFSKLVNSVYRFFMQKVYDLGLLGAKINLLISVAGSLLLIGIISWTANLVLSEQLLIGQMMAIITLVGGLGTSVINTAMANIQLQEARIAFDRMYEFAAAKPEYSADYSTKENLQKKFVLDNIEIKKLIFRFPGKSVLLKNLSFNASKGKIVTFFGEIGCGKSTLLSILLRFHKMEAGEILVRGQNWERFSTKNWREHVAIVEQHIQLFNGTVIENISLEEKIDAEKIIKFCKNYGFHDFIMEFQQGYATIVNENSSNLSGGQRQLLALARALYSRPQILLLDEATAAMGRRTEKFVIQLLNRIKKDTAVIFVTHRPQLARYTDMIYIIEEKTISASGNHCQLIKSNRFYREAFEELVISPV